jgi:hypothetical protein
LTWCRSPPPDGRPSARIDRRIENRDLPRPRVHIVSAVHKNFEVRGVLEPASEMVERNEGRVPIDYTFFEVRVE